MRVVRLFCGVFRQREQVTESSWRERVWAREKKAREKKAREREREREEGREGGRRKDALAHVFADRQRLAGMVRQAGRHTETHRDHRP